VSKTQNLTKQLEAAGPFDIDGDVLAARRTWAAFRQVNGYVSRSSGNAPLLTPPSGNQKLAKLTEFGLPNFGLTLAAAEGSGVDACTWRTPMCTAACVLVTAGKSIFPSVARARAVKTQFLSQHPAEFVVLLASELRSAVGKFGTIAARLNVASDIRWERIAPQLFELEGITFYDYTKAPASQRDDLGGRYHLTYSVSERPRSEVEAVEWLDKGGSVAVVFATTRGHELPSTWKGFQVIDADHDDGRYTDPPGVVAGLRAKGAGRRPEAGGFVKEAVST
jgi:hypothetical protein